MRHLARGIALTSIALAAQTGLLALSTSLAAARGSIRGVVVDGSTEEPQAGVRVTLTGGRVGEEQIVRKALTDPQGSYRFSGLPTGSDFFYAIDARFDGGLFPGRALTLPDDTASPPVIQTTLRVWPTASDPSAILFRRNDLFVVPSEDGLAVIESVRVLNTSERAYIGRATNGSSSVTLGFALPRDAEPRGLRIVDATLDVPELVPTDSGFGTTVAIPPGETRISFAYTVRDAAGSSDLSRPALYPILELSIYAAEGIRIESNRLSSGEEITIEAKTYREYSSDEALDAGDPLQVVAITEAGSDLMLLFGAGTLGLFGIIGGVAFFAARRKHRTPRSGSLDNRDELIAAIAELDLRHESGELTADEWRERRERLRAELDRVAGKSA
ncbi:MAG: carboxypeptidase-like regulatory domain-containing protein [Actinomycetota bacterium]